MNEFEQFYQAANELDLITDEGFFGESARLLNQRREQVTNSQFLYDCLMNIFSEPQYGTKNTIGIMLMLLKLFGEAIEIGRQDAVDVLAAFMKGTREHPELECLSSYSEYLSFHTEFKNVLATIQKKSNVTVVDKKRLAASILTAYSKGVEFVGKAFSQLLSLEQMIHQEPYDLYENSQLTIYKKIDEFLKLSRGTYDNLTTVVDRRIRNADSHLNAYFSVEENAYIMKRNVRLSKGKTKTETFKIRWEQMVLEIYPKIGWFVQGYIGANILLVLVYEDKEKYMKATKYIMSMNNNPSIL